MARTLEVKALGARDPEAREAVRGLLLGDDKHGPDIFWGGVELGAWSARHRSALATYLAGRNFVGRGFYELGARWLDEALELPSPTPRVAREALRQRAVAACALDDQAALAKVRAHIEGPDDPFKGASGGRREATLRMVTRCRK